MKFRLAIYYTSFVAEGMMTFLEPHRPKKQQGKQTDTGEAAKRQTCKDLVSGFKRRDKARHGGRILTVAGKMTGNHQSHSSADSVN